MSSANASIRSCINYLDKKIRGKIRVYLSWLFLFVSIFFIKQAPQMYGILVMIAGAALRFWASGYIDKEGRLSIAGPYRFTRNPLYVGSHLIALGLAISQDSLMMLALYLLIFVPLYHWIVLKEEEVLKEKFGPLYKDFSLSVSRYVPWFFKGKKLYSLLGHPRINQARFSLKKARENRWLEGFYTVGGIIVFIYFVLYFR